MAIGGILGGWASDRVGRVRVVAWALALFSLGAGLLGFTHSFLEFAVVRFISSLGIGCMVLVSTLVAEYVPMERRSLILGILQTGISAGYIVVISLSNWILPHYGWRTLYYVSALPVLLALAIKFAVPEPATWQASRVADRKGERGHRTNRYYLIFSNRQSRTLFILWTLASVIRAVRILRSEQLVADLPRKGIAHQIRRNGRVHDRHFRSRLHWQDRGGMAR